MQVTSTKPFQPIKLELNLETQQEADFFYAAFNWTPLAAVARRNGIEPLQIRKAIAPSETTGADAIWKELFEIAC